MQQALLRPAPVAPIPGSSPLLDLHLPWARCWLSHRQRDELPQEEHSLWLPSRLRPGFVWEGLPATQTLTGRGHHAHAPTPLAGGRAGSGAASSLRLPQAELQWRLLSAETPTTAPWGGAGSLPRGLVAPAAPPVFSCGEESRALSATTHPAVHSSLRAVLLDGGPRIPKQHVL